MVDYKNTYIELKNLTLCVDAVAAIGRTHVQESTGIPECWVLQLYLFNVNQPIALYYDNASEWDTDYIKVNSMLLNLNTGA